jgi:hypothetical protein
MAYTKTAWVEPAGAYLNRFKKQNETDTSVELIQDPVMTNTPTPFSVENMNKIEQGIYDAHQGIIALSDTLTSHSDMAETGRNLLTVLGVQSIQAAMDALSVRCNGTGTPNFRGLMIGDYLDGIDLSAIPAENDGDAGQAWNASYLNNRIVLSGFNTYKGEGNLQVTKNHLLFTFRNIPLKKRMNPTDTCIGGYAVSEIRAFLEGANGDGTGDYAGETTVTTAAFLNALKAQLGAGHILPVSRLLSTRPTSDDKWDRFICSLFLPSEHEIYGGTLRGNSMYDNGLKVHFPIYQKASTYRTKKYNGVRSWHWLCSPYLSSAIRFCSFDNAGTSPSAVASTLGGCSPVFCAA